MRRIDLSGLAIIVGCALVSSSAAAETPQQQADKLFAEGRDLLVVQKDARAACDKFEAAIALDPTAPGVMLNLGLCYEMQGKFATSLHWFRKAQSAAAEAKPRPLTEYEDAAKTHTQDLSGKVVLAKINVEGAPTDVRLSVDGRPVRREEYARLEVDSDSVIEARATGKQPFRETVQVEGRDAKTIHVVMKDEVIPPLRDPGKGRRRLAYIVGAGGVVLWGITLTYGLVVRNRYETIDDGHYEGPDGYDNAKHALRLYGTSLFIAGTAAVGTAIVLYLTAAKPYRERMEQAIITPVVTPDQVGFGYTRAF